MVPAANQSIRVLLIDDEQEHYEITRALLSGAERTTFDLDWVTTYGDAVEAVARQEHDVYLVDYFLEDHTGLDLVRVVMDQPSRRPVIMLTGRGDRHVDTEAMRAGAADYLVKGRIDPHTLERSILYAMERERASEALRHAEARSRQTFDHLPIGLFRIGLEGKLLEANPALKTLLGYPGEDLLRNGFARDFFVAAADVASVRGELARTGAVGGVHSDLRLADGSSVSVRVCAWRSGPWGDDPGFYEGSVEVVAAEPCAPHEVESANSGPRLP